MPFSRDEWPIDDSRAEAPISWGCFPFPGSFWFLFLTLILNQTPHFHSALRIDITSNLSLINIQSFTRHDARPNSRNCSPPADARVQRRSCGLFNPQLHHLRRQDRSLVRPRHRRNLRSPRLWRWSCSPEDRRPRMSPVHGHWDRSHKQVISFLLDPLGQRHPHDREHC